MSAYKLNHIVAGSNVLILTQLFTGLPHGTLLETGAIEIDESLMYNSMHIYLNQYLPRAGMTAPFGAAILLSTWDGINRAHPDRKEPGTESTERTLVLFTWDTINRTYSGIVHLGRNQHNAP